MNAAPDGLDDVGDLSDASPEGRSVGSTHPRDWPDRYRYAWAGSIAVVLGAIGWVHFTLGGADATRMFSDLVIAAGAILAALALTVLAERVDASVRTGWRLIAAGVWFEALGEISWAVYSVATASVPYPGLPDVLYLAGYPLIAAGFLAIATDPRDTRPWFRFLLDGLVVGTALLVIAWHYALQPLLATSRLTSSGPGRARVPVADILMVPRRLTPSARSTARSTMRSTCSRASAS
ncbi:MAG: hypothetical protein U5J98_02510 [Halobacteriales archaeon]|nr:hypothetical protein [Halobacteriales archaeon]